MRRAVALALACLPMAACRSNGVEGGLNFERMVIQEKADAYEASDLFPDGKVMRAPPDHTVPHEDHPLAPVVRTGRLGDSTWVARSPLGYSMDLLRRGQDRFDVYCTPCHGYDGFAGTPVGAAMMLRKPPALVTPLMQALADGRIFGIVSEGYGLMPSYADQLPVRDRWAVVAYLRALQLHQRVVLDSLRPVERDSLLARMGRAGLDAGGGGS